MPHHASCFVLKARKEALTPTWSWSTTIFFADVMLRDEGVSEPCPTAIR